MIQRRADGELSSILVSSSDCGLNADSGEGRLDGKTLVVWKGQETESTDWTVAEGEGDSSRLDSASSTRE